jgi:UDP-N-acetylglucosamine enolpyruvyl transferase
MKISEKERIFDLFQDKYKPVSIAEYARLTGRQYKVIQDKINSGTIAHIAFGDKLFILQKLNHELQRATSSQKG